MWISTREYDRLLTNEQLMLSTAVSHERTMSELRAVTMELRTQKAKDDMSIDWMRHRVNALEKQNAILLQKAAGVSLPIPEIVPSRPGTISPPSFDALPSFEDVGDHEAQRLGLQHDDLGFLEFKDDMRGRMPTASTE